jgi:hypothetical protein
MVAAAERDHVFIADSAAQGARLGEPQMMGVCRLPPADQARLRRHEPEVCAVAVAARFAQRECGFVDMPCHRIVDPRQLAL